MNNFFLKKIIFVLCVLIFFLCDSNMVYSQYVEFGEYSYRADRPPFKTYVTDDYTNILNVVDSNSLPDRYRKVVIVIDKKSYNALLNYIKKYQPSQFNSINPEHYQYIRIFNSKKTISNTYKFSLNDYKSYLIDLFKCIENNDCISKEDKNKLISKLKYWQE